MSCVRCHLRTRGLASCRPARQEYLSRRRPFGSDDMVRRVERLDKVLATSSNSDDRPDPARLREL